jgi:NADPH-dependent 2,4-dienoyl-CoA reductase/sulfur reductase-like enzyme/nitrite reductase/ring-hydroxylating ferredoxin subunit
MSEQRSVAKLSEIKNGELKEVQAGDTPVVLARVDDQCYAVAAHCTHYGAPLAEGYLSGDRIVCPWHHACFNARTGELEEPPALDSLASYPIRIEGDDIFVDLPAEANDRHLPRMTAPDTAADNRTFVIVGGGAAGYTAAQTLREDGYKGRILMITPEDRLPYDRPNLSKDYLQGAAEPEWMPLRPDEFYDEHGIEALRGERVKSVALDQKQVVLESGKTLAYDSLLVATGGTPRKLDVKGNDLTNIFELRDFNSADTIIAAVDKAQSIAVIGASFIGMEAAFSLTRRGKQVTVIAPDKVPFEKTLGAEVGAMLQKVHELNGVTFRLGATVTGFEGNGSVNKVLLEAGPPIEIELVIVGVGVRPATEILVGCELHKDGGVIADQYLSIAADAYAAGDIVHYPRSETGELERIEHWRTAMQQGRVAAHNMAGERTPFEGVPFFWTRQFDATLNYVGHAVGWNKTIVMGKIDDQDFLIFYLKDQKVLAVAGMNRDRELAMWEEKFRLGTVPPAADLENVKTGRVMV